MSDPLKTVGMVSAMFDILCKGEKDQAKVIEQRARFYKTQKGIIIGHKGNALKQVGISARKSLQNFFNKKIYLELRVKVSKNWRSNNQQLKKLGY